MLLLVSLAFAHADPTPHVHTPSFGGLLVLVAWVLAGILFLRRAAA